MNEVYRERAHLVANLALQYPSVLAYNDPEEPSWPLVYVQGPAGQMSWHVSPDDLDLFEGVPLVHPEDPRAAWDGHTTEEKYERLASIRRVDPAKESMVKAYQQAVGGAA